MKQTPTSWSAVLAFPPGPAWAPFVAGGDWPTAVGKDADWRMVAHRRDADGLPSWTYAHLGFTVTESLRPSFVADGVMLARTLTLEAPLDGAAIGEMTLRAWVADSIEKLGADHYRTADGVELRVVGARTTLLREGAAGTELLVTPPQGTLPKSLTVEMSW